MRAILLFFCIAVCLPQNGWAIGGVGALCNPEAPDYGNCTLAPVPFQDSVSNTVTIPGGSYSSPFIADSANTHYVLQGDMVANSSAIVVTANYVIIDLNGHTITYNTSSPGEGVSPGNYNLHHISIRNGRIIQGNAMSEGDQYGRGNNPVGTFNSSLQGNRSVNDLHVANLYVQYGGRDVGGIICSGNNGLYEENTIEDTYEFGTLKNRHQGVEALTGSKNVSATGNIYRNNTIVNTRQRGIVTGNSAEVYNNVISLRSIATNSVGISQYAGQDIVIHDNTIIGRGEHPIGIGGGGGDGSKNYDVYNNVIDLQTTALGEEYGAQYEQNPNNTYKGNSAAGVRVTWGGDNLNFSNNQITITTNSSYTGTYSPTGTVAYIDGGGKGLFIGIRDGESSMFSSNTISVTGTGSTTFGITCSYNFSDGLFVVNNTITSNHYNVIVGDDYGPCNNFPLFSGNTFIKTGTNPEYRTIASTYNDTDRNSQARFVDNIYLDGASEDNIALRPQNAGLTEAHFGDVVNDQYLFDYTLHDDNNSSSTLIRDDHSPAITLSYRLPGQKAPPPSEPVPIITEITEK